MTPKEALLLLYRAFAEPIGLVLRASDPEKARQQLYKARRDSKDATLDQLQVRLVALGEGNMVITKAKVKAPLQAALPQPLDSSAEELDL